MGKVFEPEAPSILADDLQYRLDYDFKRRMGELDESYEDFKVRRKLKKTFERFGIGGNPKRKKFMESLEKVLQKHSKALDELDD